MPASPSRTPEPTPSRTPVIPPTPRQIVVRSVVIAAVIGLFVAVGYGRWETARTVTLFVIVTVIAAVVLVALFTALNRGAGRR